ncbi:major outer membrane protein [Legionella birminghamensis]|uniref:Major outer membrane protein n=1 Tax=Legionella birminghamensis TaxID=28083 RepID=A0A378IDC0_9GAMM|nr:Lpg1974 family pore-forming outer membrane protein [Legionella birminghamensis]KTC68859.1 major outer membrane protein [Legionella birminghamensis]STX33199.1 major outer membrane protein [Legionella birminghamensis]
MTAFRRTALSAFVIGLCNSPLVVAGSMGPIKDCSGYHLFAGIDALYLEPRNDDLDYVTVYSSGYTKTHNVNLDYDWGFRLYGGVKLLNNNDITIAWQRLHTNDLDNIGSDGNQPVEPRWLTFFPWEYIRGKSSFDYDEVSGVFAHTKDFANGWLVRYGAGAEYAEIDSRLSVKGRTTDFVERGYSNVSDFHGFGPRVEADIFYNLYQDISVFASANSALLIGERTFALHALDLDGTSRDFADRSVVVPKFGLRVGLDYKKSFDLTGSTSLIDLQLGWQAETYIDPIERPSTGLIGGEGSVGVVLPRTSNFSNQGLFFGVKLTSDCL